MDKIELAAMTLKLIEQGHDKFEIERSLNALARFMADVPTGVSVENRKSH